MVFMHLMIFISFTGHSLNQFGSTAVSHSYLFDLLGEYIALYQNQRAIMKQKHFEKEQYINILAKDKEEMKVPAMIV